MSILEKLVLILRKISSENKSIKGCGISSKPGLPLAAAYPAMIEPGIVSAMSAALMGVGQRASLLFENGAVDEIIIRGKEGILFIKMITNECMLIIVATINASIQILQNIVSKYSDELRDILKEEKQTILL